MSHWYACGSRSWTFSSSRVQSVVLLAHHAGCQEHGIRRWMRFPGHSSPLGEQRPAAWSQFFLRMGCPGLAMCAWFRCLRQIGKRELPGGAEGAEWAAPIPSGSARSEL